VCVCVCVSVSVYLVLADYERKDSHQVNLKANQLVYVIEKHDTGECKHRRCHDNGHLMESLYIVVLFLFSYYLLVLIHSPL